MRIDGLIRRELPHPHRRRSDRACDALATRRAWGKQPGRMLRTGVLMPLAADDPKSVARIAAFLGGLIE